MKYENTLAFAQKMDQEDALASFRKEFYFPVLREREVLYLAGNSLGLQPKGVQDAVLDVLAEWATFGTDGYSLGDHAWMDFQDEALPLMAKIVGAQENEIAIMNQLTTNLHLALSSFYQPEGKRKKVIIEAGAFPSDFYAIASQMKLRGIDPEGNLIIVAPEEGKMTVANEDIIGVIKETGDELALVLIGGVHHQTGQAFFMKSITAAAHEVGAFCGFDLAHAAGNIELQLHEWETDFAVWCTYKYLNAGPGSIGGLFIHERHVKKADLQRLRGWWGVTKSNRFELNKVSAPQATAGGWQLSIPSPMHLATLLASLRLFEEAGFDNLRKKSKDLTGYLLFILNEVVLNSPQVPFEIVTPFVETQRGAQVSLRMGIQGKHQFDMLKNNRAITTFTRPVIRIAPVPLYNSFEDVFEFGKVLEHTIHFSG